MILKDSIHWSPCLEIQKYTSAEAYLEDNPYEIRQSTGNLLTTYGRETILKSIVGGSNVINFSSGLSFQVGSGLVPPLLEDERLTTPLSDRLIKVSPITTTNSQITLGPFLVDEGVFVGDWNEWGLFVKDSQNRYDDGFVLFNHRIDSYGNKVPYEIWKVTITISL